MNTFDQTTRIGDTVQILDAMRRSDRAEDICFLLTTYIETLQFYAAAERLPVAVVALPVNGLEDIEDRYCTIREARRCEVASAGPDAKGNIVGEAQAVLYEARCRLRALGAAAGWPARSLEMNDIRQSA